MPKPPTPLRYTSDVLTGRSTESYGGHPPARVQRAVGAAMYHAHGRAIVQAARVRAVHYVAHTAVRAIEDLTDMEALAIRRNPLSEPRLRAINDTVTAVLAHIVAETGRS